MLKRILHNQISSPITNHLIDYPTPINLSYLWSFGSIAGLFLIIQLITGIFLAMFYCSNITLAFASVEHIMRDVPFGWWLRYMHSNCASFFFIVVYLHMARGLYYGSYLSPRQVLWKSGIFIFILMMATAFLGYILPWAQMSYWGATVISNLFSAIPLAGQFIVYWLWAGFSVDNPTLTRFFSLHFLLPFLLTALSVVHLYLLHLFGSNNPIGVESKFYSISFFPFFYVKDLFSFIVLLFFYFIFVFFYPNVLGDVDNYIMANPLQTPEAIVPEWYFLSFYAILRSIPDKLFGVCTMGLALIILLILPFFSKSKIRSTQFRPIYKIVYWLFINSFLLLGWLGAKPVESPFIEIGQISTFAYFLLLLIGIPFSELIETKYVSYSSNIN